MILRCKQGLIQGFWVLILPFSTHAQLQSCQQRQENPGAGGHKANCLAIWPFAAAYQNLAKALKSGPPGNRRACSTGI